MSEANEKALEQQRDFLQVFSTPQGQRVLADIIDASGFLKEAIMADPVTAGMALGRRNLAVWILNTMGRNLSDLPDIIRHRSQRR